MAVESDESSLNHKIALIAVPVAVMWLIEVFERISGFNFDAWGIRPRSLKGLPGILLSPFLHLDFQHLIANTLPFVILGGLVLVSSARTFISVSLNIIVLAGLGVWLIAGRQEIHIGASGLVFGYFGFLIMRGWFERSLSSIFIAVVVFAVYGGMIWGVLPVQRGVSWEGHLMGFLAGAAAAWSLAADKWRGRRLA